MTSRSWTRRLSMLVAGIATVLLAAGAVAYACTSLATLDLESRQAAVGETVDGTGEGFSGNPTASEVQIHFDNRNGPVLWSGAPNMNGDIAFSFETPDGAPGQYVLIATQTDARGSDVYGTPARASFEVTAPEAEQGQQPPAQQEGQPEQAEQPAPAQEQQPAPAEEQQAPPQPQAAPQQEAAPAQDTAEQPAAQQQPAQAEQPAAAEDQAPAEQDAAAPARDEAAQEQARPAPAEQQAEAPAADRSTTMETDSEGPTVLALSLVGLGVVLTLGAGAFLVAANRRKAKAIARAPLNLFRLFS